MDYLVDILRNIPGASEFLAMFAQVAGLLSVFTVIFWLGGIVVFVAQYLFSGMTLMYIGRKAGLDTDWMPFVPFASIVYQLRVVREEWWKMFFLGRSVWAFCSALLFLIFNLIHFNLAVIVLILYSICCIAYYVYYMHKYYAAFGINPNLIIAIAALVSGTINFILDVLIAYTGLFAYGRNPYDDTHVIGDPPPPPINGSGSVTCLSGMYSGNTFNMVPGEELTLGRDATSVNIVLEQNSDKVSRKHCGILYNGGGNYLVTDYSSNGTMTGDGSRLARNIPVQLPSGTVICLGNNENRFKLN